MVMVTVVYQDRTVCIECSSPISAPATASAPTPNFCIAPMNDLYGAAMGAYTCAGGAVYRCCTFRYGEHVIGCHVAALGGMAAIREGFYRDPRGCMEWPSSLKAPVAASASASTPRISPISDLYSSSLRACTCAGGAVYRRCAFRYGEHVVGYCVGLGIIVEVRDGAFFVKSVVQSLGHDSSVVILTARMSIVVIS